MRVTEHNLDSLRGKIRELQEENQELKNLLSKNGIPYESPSESSLAEMPDEYDEDQASRILPHFLDENAAKLFYKFFWGRTDVFAKRGKKGGYFPQCSNSFNKAVCPRERGEKQFCDEDCPGKKWKRLEPWMILQHLRGEKDDCSDVIGVYPLFEDNTCRFLVFDFDNHEKESYKNDYANTDDLWHSEVDALRLICEKNGISHLVERSRSGKGAHLWIFFSEPIQASIARNFGFALLDRGASSINLPSFKYYDRMYPSQDVLSKLGNLIALPLQGKALRYGNSAFVDRSWNAWPDQWKALQEVHRLSCQEILQYLEQWKAEAGNDSHYTKYKDGGQITRPWKAADHFYAEDVIGTTLHIVQDNGIYVDELNLMPRMINRIKGMATIDNPEYWINMRSGRSNYYNLRTISLWKESEDYLRVPRGLIDQIREECDKGGIICDITDKRTFGRPIRIRFTGELREQQKQAVESVRHYECGVISAPTGSGKTVLGAYLIAQRKVSTLILIENSDLLPQWVSTLERFLSIDEEPPAYQTKTGRNKKRDSVIGTLCSGQDKTTGIIDIAMIGSAYHKGEFFPNIDSYGMILMDECQHAASNQAREVLERARAKYVYGLSATPMRSDKKDEIIFQLLGPIRHRYHAKEQADSQGFVQLVYPRFTRVVHLSDDKLPYYQAQDLIADSETRNKQIINDAIDAIREGRTPIILTRLKRHAKLLFESLQNAADHVFLLYGDQTPKQNHETRQHMDLVKEHESVILIATGQKIGEGFDYPRLDTLILASPIKFEGSVTQYVGRLSRIHQGKKSVIVYDYVDTHISYFDKQYRQRLTTYKKLGYKIISTLKTNKQKTSSIFDQRDYQETFFRDLVEANHEIVIASPHLTENKVCQMIDLLVPRLEAGLKVTVITLEPDSCGYGDTINQHIMIDDLKRNGIVICTTTDESEHYAVIDHRLVWHGGMNLLGKADVWDNLIRVESAQAADELLAMTDDVLNTKGGNP